MATPTQQKQFITFWEPYAKDAGQQLGVPWQWILGQWAKEAGWSLRTPGSFNPGNIETLGSRTAKPSFVNYAKPSDFVTSYVATFSADFPSYTLLKKGQSKIMSIAELFGNNQIYDPPEGNAYGTSVASVAASLRQFGIQVPTQAKIDKNLSTPIVGAENAAQQATQSTIKNVSKGISGFFGGLGSMLGVAGAFLGGIILIIIGLVLVLHDDIPKVVDNVVPFSKKGTGS